MLLSKIRKSRIAKIIAMMLAMETTCQWFFPSQAHALTTGPSQPEMQSFQPVGTSDMVDVFSGDFNYNIPLLDIDGYPINISYNAGITMDQEASWVGLGWNINPGAINRNMRGIPDDFSGDMITREFNMKPNRTYGATVGVGAEGFGVDALGLSYSITMNFNNYKGVGFEQSLNMQFSSGKEGKGPFTGGLGITSGNDGLNLSPSLSFSQTIKEKDDADIKGSSSIGLSFNSRSGLKNLSLNASVTESATKSSVANGHVRTVLSTYSQNGSAQIDFSTATYTPQVNIPMINSSLAFSTKVGGHLFGFDASVNLSGFYSEQRLQENEISAPAFGYMNTQYGIASDNAVHDLNREKDIPFTDKTPDLPLTNYSYDIYTVTGQGVGGNYRPFRSDLGTLCDAATHTTSLSGSLGIEATVGNLVHAGADVTITDVNTTSGKWSGDDNVSGTLKFRSSVSGDAMYEPWYFKQAGEKAVDSDPSLFTDIGGSDPVMVHLQSAGSPSMSVTADGTMTQQFTNGNTHSLSIPSGSYRNSRQRRNQAISYVPFSWAYNALQPSILDHTNASMDAYEPSTTEGQYMQQHHIGEISVLRADGARYVYGLPAYNIMQKEVTFNVQGRTHNCSTGIVTYSSGDNSTGNTLGIDNYYSAVTTPPYAHSYMLTAIISPDYVDYDTIEGPSKGDLGTYTKFNYSRAQTSFNWRTPIGSHSANYNEGYKSETSDDKGSYIYGQKEIWYLSSIETKNYVAIFTLSAREDGYGVSDEDGTSLSGALKKLDQIDLYSKPDYEVNGSNATPIKTVHFEYNYKLCPSTPNRNPSTNGSGESGKLTLTKIYFTYGHSYKAKLSPYKFNYADRDFNGSMEVNYAYNLKGYDRWGNYKPNVVSSSCGNLDSLTTSEYPYVTQDTTLANKYAAAWALTKIDLPSGSSIKVNYESDDYAYVQDRKADQMFQVTDVLVDDSSPDPGSSTGTSGSSPTRVSLMDIGSYSNKTYFLFFKLQTPIASSTSWANIRSTLMNNYLGNSTTNMYFRFLSDITNNGDYEYVSGYADLDDSGYSGSTANSGACGVAAASSGYYNYGWVRLKNVPIGDREGSSECNPICKANWQYGRLQMPRKVWNQPDPQGSTAEQVLTAMAGSNFFTNIIQTFKGPNRTIRDKGYGLNAVTQKSWIRLSNPNWKKLGGGSRVKSIVMSDNWKAMTNNSGYTPNDATYGQVYSYTTTENGTTISSGVASYEPQLGGDENPWRQPVFVNEKHRLAPDDESYLEQPFGEMFFPAPGVGYSHVEVRNLQYAGVSRHATGYTVQEFYTAKDFPTITRNTPADVVHKKTSPILSLLRIKMKDYLTASQGYVIELNDMHGKPKAQYVYAEDQVAPISEVHYFYKTNPANDKQLDNTIYTVSKDGSVSQSLSGVDYDFVNDMREEQTKVINGGLNLNLSGFIAGIFPVAVPTIFPSWNIEDSRFRSTVITKVVNRYGILERTEAHDAGSTVTTENLAWDAETGELLLTKTKNDFDDPVYNFTYPAHWAYDRMGQAYKNLMAGFATTLSGGSATIPSASAYFVPGDELGILDNSGNHYKGWVCSVSGSTLNIIDADGQPLSPANTSCVMIIFRSGRRNQQALAIGGVTLLTNPLKDTNADDVYDTFEYNSSDKILNAKAQEYAEHWQMEGGYTTPAYSTCDCEKSTIYGLVGDLLSILQDDGKLLTSGELLYNSGTATYYHGFSSSLNSFSGNVYWYPTVSGQTLTGIVDNNPAVPGNCTVTLQLPAPYTFSQIDTLHLAYFISHPGTCSGGNSYEFTADITMLNGQLVTATGTTSCWQMGENCTSGGSPISCGKNSGDTINPYFEDVLGVWRPIRSHLYLAERHQDTISGNTDIRKDGYFITHNHTTGSSIAFQPFWNSNSGNDWTKDTTYWTWSSEVTKYNPFGNEIENRDALSRYSAAVFGYNHSLPIAVGSNAQYQEIAYDGFEDYDFIDSSDCRPLHFNFYNDLSKRSSAEAHTGLYSMRVINGDSVSNEWPFTSQLMLPPATTCPYTLSATDFTGGFSPITYKGDQTYVLSYWVKETGLTQPVFDYPDAEVIVKYINSAGYATYATMTLVQKSDIIDGWQQYQYTFVIPAGTLGAIDVTLKNTGGAGIVGYFDDIRLHPFDSNMKSYVYNPVNLRFTYELDENNYATIYEYDEEGMLIRVKKETANGIMTIKESRNNTSHE